MSTYTASDAPWCPCGYHRVCPPYTRCKVCLDECAMQEEREAASTGRQGEMRWAGDASQFVHIQRERENAARFFGEVVSDAKRRAELRDAARIGRSHQPTLGRMTPKQRWDQILTVLFLLGIAACMVGLVWPNLKHLGEGMATHSMLGWEVEKP